MSAFMKNYLFCTINPRIYHFKSCEEVKIKLGFPLLIGHCWVVIREGCVPKSGSLLPFPLTNIWDYHPSYILWLISPSTPLPWRRPDLGYLFNLLERDPFDLYSWLQQSGSQSIKLTFSFDSPNYYHHIRGLAHPKKNSVKFQRCREKYHLVGPGWEGDRAAAVSSHLQAALIIQWFQAGPKLPFPLRWRRNWFVDTTARLLFAMRWNLIFPVIIHLSMTTMIRFCHLFSILPLPFPIFCSSITYITGWTTWKINEPIRQRWNRSHHCLPALSLIGHCCLINYYLFGCSTIVPTMPCIENFDQSPLPNKGKPTGKPLAIPQPLPLDNSSKFIF